MKPTTKIFRILWRNKPVHSFNLLGLTLGFIVTILVSMYLITELKFDKHVRDYQNKYRLIEYNEPIFANVASQLIRQQVPELKLFCQIDEEGGNIKINENEFTLKKALLADSTFVKMFDIRIVNGNPLKALSSPNTCIISQSTAHLFFGMENPVGKTITFDDKYLRTVSGVYQDIPLTSHIQADIVSSITSEREIDKRYYTAWDYVGSYLYVELHPETNVSEVEQKINEVIIKNVPWGKEISPGTVFIELQRMDKIHLNSSQLQWDGLSVRNDKSILRIFLIIVILVLSIACFNYINLTTAHSQRDVRTTGIKKIFGAGRYRLAASVIYQTLFITLLALVLALIVSYLLLPAFNTLLNTHLTLNLLLTPLFIGILLSVILLTTVSSGIYPSVAISGISPLKAIQEKTDKSKKGLALRPVLVTTQFVISIVLIAGLLLFNKQFKLLTSELLGFDKEMLLEIGHYKDQKSYSFLFAEFKKLAGVKDVTAASNLPGEYINNENPLMVFGESPKDKHPQGCMVGIAPNYFEVLKTRILEGRGFSEQFSNDSDKVLINETAVKALKLKEPLGQKIVYFGKVFTVIGVTEDVQYRTLRERSLPILYSIIWQNYNKIAVRLSPGDHKKTISEISMIWKNRFSHNMNYMFTDDKLHMNYAKESTAMKLLSALVVVAICITVIGLLGLIRFMTERRTKEIGIRRVNGAKVDEILFLISKTFIRWVLVAFIVACPIAYYAMNKWLESFAYKTSLNWWLFVLAGLTVLCITLITIGWQGWRAANRNPVEAVRHE